MDRFARVLRMPLGEIGWRARERARIGRDRLACRLTAPRWDRAAIGGVLAPAAVDHSMRRLIARKDWRAVHRALGALLRARPARFPIDPAGAVELRDEILARWPHAAADASRRADGIMGGRYDLLGYRGLSYDGPAGRVDWHFDPVHRRRAARVFWADVDFLDPANGDHKVIWEINRHQHWLALGRALWLTRDRRYGWAIVSQLEDWLDANPPLIGVNWASMLELGLRSLSWLWALHLLLADTDEGAAGRAQTPWLVDLLPALDRQLRHVEQNLSRYFSPNTHLTGEALALYTAGVALPELAASPRWIRTGRRYLLGEIDRQICPDGGHAERSMHYHRYTLDFYLLALLMAERAGDTDAVARFTDAATRLAVFARSLADDAGRLPLIGDDDGGMLWPIAGRASDDARDSLALAAVVLGRPDLAPWGVPEEVFWIAGRTAIEQEPFVETSRAGAEPLPSRAFPDTGYVALRDGAGGHLVFDAGPHGYMNAGHAHADALSITLRLRDRSLLVDPGTATYTTDPALRDRMRCAAGHNTLVLDGQPAAVPAGPFHWRSRADARLAAARHNPAFDGVEGSCDAHDGARHRRTVFRAPGGGWLIVDEVLGRGHHAAELHWHFDPAWMVTADTARRLHARHFDGAGAWIVHDGDATRLYHGDEPSGLGWVAPAYGTLLPAWAARVSRTSRAPFSVATWIGPGGAAPVLARIAAECDPGGSPAVAVRVLQQDAAWTTMLRAGEGAVRETRGCGVGAYQTNARLLHYGTRGGRLVSLAACDASHVLALRDGWLSLAADEPVDDVHVELAGDRIEIVASRPAPRLRLQGTAVAQGAAVHLNGRELPASARERTDSIVALPVHWGEPRVMTPAAIPQGV